MYGRAQNSSARAEERRQWPCQELQCIIVEDNNTAIALCNILESNILEYNRLESNILESNIFKSNILESKILKPNVLESKILESIILEPNILESNALESKVLHCNITFCNIAPPQVNAFITALHWLLYCKFVMCNYLSCLCYITHCTVSWNALPCTVHMAQCTVYCNVQLSRPAAYYIVLLNALLSKALHSAQCTVQMVLHHMSHCAVPLNALPCKGGVPCTVPLNARHCSATVQRAEGEVSRDGA